MKVVSQLIYLAKWFLTTRVLGYKQPLQSVVFVTGGCNSTCRHCVTCKDHEKTFKSFAEAEKDFRLCYQKGARILDIEGVNLVSWKDQHHTVNDLFTLARKIGFYSTSTMIPAGNYEAWKKLNVTVDVVWVSILDQNDLVLLNTSCTDSLYMVVNSQNYTQIPMVLEYLENHPQIPQIAFNFHTPFPGTEAFTLRPEQREQTIQWLIDYKKKDYRIMNTVSGLKNMLHLNFKRYCWICNFIYCDGRYSSVCLDQGFSDFCNVCGFCMSGEMNSVFRFRPDTIWAGLKSRL